MQHRYFNDITPNEGEALITCLLLNITEKADRNGNPYCVLTFSDGQTRQEASMFSRGSRKVSKADLDAKYPAGHVYDVTLHKEQRGPDAPVYTNVDVINQASGNTSIDDFIVTAPVKAEECYEAILQMIDDNSPSQAHGTLAGLTHELYAK